MACVLVDEAEHPDRNRVAGGEFHVVFDQVADFGILDLPALLILATYLKGNTVNLEIRDFGGCDFVNLGSPNHEVGLPHVAGIDDAVLGKGHGNIAVAQVEFLHLSEEVIAVTGFMEGVEESGGGQILDVVGHIVATDAEVAAQGVVAGLIGYALGEDVHQFLQLGNSNIAMALSEDGIIDSGNMRETNFLVWTSQVHKVTSSKISDFEIDGITFEVGGKNKKGRQIKDAEVGYLVKDDMEFAAGNSIPIWMFGFIY